MEAIRQPDLEIPVNYKKLSPGLCLALDDYDKEGPPALLRYSHTLGVVPGANDLEPSRMPVFVLCAPEAELGHLEEHGIQVNQGSGRVRTAFVPLESMTRLTEQPEVERVMASHTLRPLMDVASKRCNLPQFRTRMPLTGKGVVIGIIDSGIDSGHPAFSGRIHSIWDQTLPGSGVLEAGFGRELKGLQLSKSQDADGHGTHVAGIAAGDHSSLGGIAPQATLVVVKTDFNDAHIADGIRYIARIAREQDRPFVINLSLGGHNDPHDGTDPLSATIDEISGPGGIVCCAAGNEGNDNIHAGVLLAPNSRKTIRFRIPANTVTGVLLNGWYPGANRLEVAVQTPSGFVTPFQAVFPPGAKFTKRYTLPEAHVSVATPDVDPNNGDHTFRINVGAPSPGGALKGGVWRLLVRNTSSAPARLDVWTIDGLLSPEVVFSGTSVDDSVKIGSPGSAASAITVASFTTRVQWTDIDGTAQSVGLDLDDISDFSSEGPLRTQVRKPDLAAPGAMIASCLSSHANAERAMTIDNRFQVMAGTSMAAPFITGLVALLLEKDPGLDPSGIKSRLAACATIPGQPQGSFHPKWGNGMIDVNAL